MKQMQSLNQVELEKVQGGVLPLIVAGAWIILGMYALVLGYGVTKAALS